MRILSVELLTDDIPGTAEFYTGVLGLPLHMSDRNTLDLGAGTSRLLFRRSADRNPVYHLAFNIPRNRIEEAAAFMRRKTELIAHEAKEVIDFSAWNAKAIYFYDNNGNIMELIARADLDNASTLPFSGAQLLCISEVAIVTNNVKEMCDTLTAETGVQPYEKQPVHENFAALGDAEGLFIISARDRHWFPTQQTAQHCPLKVKISHAGAFKSFRF